jgi:hypothetical protein
MSRPISAATPTAAYRALCATDRCTPDSIEMTERWAGRGTGYQGARERGVRQLTPMRVEGWRGGVERGTSNRPPMTLPLPLPPLDQWLEVKGLKGVEVKGLWGVKGVEMNGCPTTS